MPNLNEPKIISGNANLTLAKAISRRMSLHRGLNVGLVDARVERFSDQEIFVEVYENVRGEDMFILQSTSNPANDNLMELLIMSDALRRSSASRITAVIPYFGYARQDRKDAGRVPITAKLVANLITRAGADRVLAMDLHAAQIQGFFDVPVDHLYAAPVLNNHLQSIDLPTDDLIVVSPDVGGIKRAVGHGQRLNAPLAIVDKRRVSADTTTSANIIGASVEGKVALMFDDMISTAGSICSAAEVLHNHGAKQIFAAATHGLLVGPAVERLQAAPLSGIIVTDSIPLAQEKTLPNITVLSVASLLGQAIKRIHRNESVSIMFQ